MPAPGSTSVLYLSHDGMLEPLGESQVLAYLERLAAGGFRITLISFEKPRDLADEARLSTMRARMEKAGISWHPLRYHNRPPVVSTVLDLWRAYNLARGLAAFQIVHARSYPMAILGLALKKKIGAAFIFDMRGFWADERLESGSWSRGGLMYRFFKGVEKRALQRADAVVSLTQAAVDEIRRFPYMNGLPTRFKVIPTCTDLTIFRPGSQSPAGRFTLGYVGSTGLWYDFSPVARVFALVRELRPDARLLLLTRDPEGPLRKQLQDFPPGAVELRSASRGETAEAMRGMHFTAFFLRPSYAKTASMPTKLGEFLGSGVPCLTNRGCGDLERFFASAGDIGRAVKDPGDEKELREAVKRVVELAETAQARTRCREVAEATLSLDAGVTAY
ncbi:MAG: glycosyltransferase, partial [Bdellovibrionota bacterium]